jgi:drug/metabolite transporter (DMT)-like permease
MRPPLAQGLTLAALAALAFGLTTPLIARAGAGLGPFATAALLYAGAALTAQLLRLRRGATDAPLRRADTARIVAVALVGGALAPTLLAWGLQRTGGTIGSLLLNLEAVFTVLLARAIYREPIGGRVAAAVALIVLGGVALTLDATADTGLQPLGVVAVAAATAAWATDNTLTRPLAERDPLDVVAAKGALGALVTTLAALLVGEPPPTLTAAAILLACGATGYGLSLRLYLLAQRRIGAGRTGSIFALAPFVGAAAALALGDRALTTWSLAAAACFLLGVYLHLTEHHAHPHAHPDVAHDHPHRHDDGHHDHAHDPPVAGEHAHPHLHTGVVHEHAHAPDLHHDHH